MTLLRRARFGLSLGLIALLGVMFIATIAKAHDGLRPGVPVADRVMTDEDGACPDRPDQDCRMACRVLCHGLVVVAPDPPRPMAVQLMQYREPPTKDVAFAGETEDPPPRA